MPETVEKPKFLLLETIMDVIEEKATEEQLRTVLEESKKSLETIKQEFEEDLADLEDRVKEGARDEIQMVYKFFDDWENAFKAIEEYFKTRQKFDLIRAGEMVKRSSEGINFAFENYVNQVLKVMGPTDIPHLNLLIEAVREVEEDGVPTHKLSKVIADEYIMAEGAIRELEFERKHFQFTEQELLIKAYKELQEALTKIGFFIKEGNKDLLREGIEGCKEAYPKIKQLIPMVNYKRMIQKPTKSPAANLLLNMAIGLKKGTINEQMFIDALKDVEDDFNMAKRRFEALSRQEVEADYIKEELNKALKGLELFENAINDYYAFLDEREGLLLDQAEWELKDAVEILYKAMQFFDDLAEREGKIPCAKCGKYNLPDRKTCQYCGAILPKAAGMMVTSTFNVQVGEKTIDLGEEEAIPENLEIMFNAVNQVAEGEISLEEFENTINWLHGIMETHKSAGLAPLPKINLEKLSPEEREKEEKNLKALEEAKALFEEAYRDWEEGLDYFREFIEVGDKNLLINGVKVMWEGNKKLNKVKEITKQFLPEGSS